MKFIARRYLTIPLGWVVRWKYALRYLCYCLQAMFGIFLFGVCFATETKINYKEHEIAAYRKAGCAQASILQQTYVQLVAPDVQFQLQQLSNEIAVANGVDMTFHVHITNDGYIGTFSTGSGDIFIPIGYLDMVANRDEIAFGLAREIAIQHRLVHLNDMEKVYSENRRNQEFAFYSSLVVSTAVNSAFNYYVVFPINKKIVEEIIDIPRVSPQMSKELQRFVIFEKNLQYRQLSSNVGQILGILLGWAPRTISNETFKLVTHLIQVSNEDSDSSRRKNKNEIGLIYMRIAGFNPEAGIAVIGKIEDWWKTVESEN